jgi:RNA polymerase sigma factor FliA
MRPARAGLKLLARPPLVEAALWRRLRFEEDAHCRTPLFNQYTSLARAIAKREFRRRPPYGLELADFEQLAFGGLLEAIDRFDPLHGAPFEAFARRRIRGAIADGHARSSEKAAQFNARRRTESDRLRSLAPDGVASGNSIAELADLASALAIGIIAENARLIASHAESGLGAYETRAWRDTQLRLLAEVERLPETEKTVMQQHYLNDIPFTEIARLLGVSKGRIAQIHRAAINRVRIRLRQSE